MTKGIENLAESSQKEKINAFFEQYRKVMRFLRNFSERRGADNLCIFKLWKEVSSAFVMRVISMTDEEFQLFQEKKKSRESEKTGYTLKVVDSKSKVKPSSAKTASRIEMEVVRCSTILPKCLF